MAFAVVSAAAATTPLPRRWLQQALCVHRHESIDWYRTTDWLGRPSVDHGGMQIDIRTWARFAPRRFPRSPEQATPHEQLVVAYKIWLANGRRFGGHQWYLSASRCGVA